MRNNKELHFTFFIKFMEKEFFKHLSICILYYFNYANMLNDGNELN